MKSEQGKPEENIDIERARALEVKYGNKEYKAIRFAESIEELCDILEKERYFMPMSEDDKIDNAVELVAEIKTIYADLKRMKENKDRNLLDEFLKRVKGLPFKSGLQSTVNNILMKELL